MKQNRFPAGWDETRVKQVLAVYTNQTEAETIAEDESGVDAESALESTETLMTVPKELVPQVRELIAKRER